MTIKFNRSIRPGTLDAYGHDCHLYAYHVDERGELLLLPSVLCQIPARTFVLNLGGIFRADERPQGDPFLYLARLVMCLDGHVGIVYVQPCMVAWSVSL